MTIVEALKISDAIRRKDNPTHSGALGDGYVHISYFLMEPTPFTLMAGLKLTKEDLLADDWEAMEQK